ncbi:MAG: NUDIX hydrolase [Ilumatobacteraceae bacterium]|nr:NUDIX hydrolase [Ilumatobacteraceae bacterium]
MPSQPQRQKSTSKAGRPAPQPAPGETPARPPDFHVAVDVVLLSLRNDLLHIGVVQRRGADAFIDGNVLTRRGNPRAPRRVERLERHAQHHWALPGGHVGNTLLNDVYGTGPTPDTTLTQAALRVLARETNLSLTEDDLHQIGAFGDADRDPRSGRTVSVAFLAIVGDDRDLAVHPNDAVGHVSRVQFRPVVDVLARPNRLEFDHEDIVLAAIGLVRNLVVTTPLAAKFCREEFTIGELRRVYEALFHESLDSAEAAERPGHADSVRGYLAKLEALTALSDPGVGRAINELAMMMPPLPNRPDFVMNRSVGEIKSYPSRALSSEADGLASRSTAPVADIARQIELMSRLLRQSTRTKTPRPPRLLKALDPTNFARKMQKIGILAPVEGVSRPTFDRYGKAAALFRLDPSREQVPFFLRLEGLGKNDSSD